MSRKLTFCILNLFFIQITKKGTAGDQTPFTVSAGGSGDFTSIQAAVDAGKAFPEGRVTIFMKYCPE